MKTGIVGIAMACAAVMALVGCGGGAMNQPAPQAQVSVRADHVFQNLAQTWAFQSQCQNMQQDGTLGPWIVAHSWIEVQPQPDTVDVDGVTVIHNSIWHYTKDQPCAYWMPNSVFYEDPTKPLTELYFYLSTDSTFEKTGSWYSPGGHIIAPNGFPWDTSSPRVPQDFEYTNPTDPGKPRPYLILANSGISVETTFTDLGVPNNRWATFMTVDSQGCLSSDQFEGVRGHETWHFCSDGLHLVEAHNQGGLADVDPRLNLIRMN